MSLSVIGTGSALPERTVKNDELTAFLDTNDEWIRSRTGIEERHVLTKETVTDLALLASRRALENANVQPEELDYILCCTIGGDYIAPSVSCLIQAALEATCPALDVNAGCCGFMYGLDVAWGIFARKKARKVLLIAVEGLSRIANWTDRSICVLLGDGAAAFVLEEGDDLLYLDLVSKGWADPLYIPFPSGNSPFRDTEKDTTSYMRMNGQEVYKFAVNAITTGVEKALQETGTAKEEIAYLVLHQANLRIIEAARKKLKIPPEKCPVNIQKVGNMSAATIPLVMDEWNRAGKFSEGDLLMLGGFGAGLTSGTALLRWSQPAALAAKP